MSEDSTTSDTRSEAGTETDEDRAARMRAITDQTQALFGGGAEPQDEQESTSQDDVEEDDLQDDEVPEEGSEEEDPTEPVSSAPAFGILFQAPDLSDVPRRRSRRATSAVTTPVEGADDDGAEREGAADDQGDDEQDDSSSGGSSGRRRRRGGKGRRRSGQGETGDDDGRSAPETDRDGASLDDADAGGDTGNDAPVGSEGSGEQSSAGSSSSSRRRRNRRTGSGGEQQAGSGSSGSQGRPQSQASDGGSGTSGDSGGSGGAGSSGGGSEDEQGSSTRRRRRRTRSGESPRSAKDEVTSVRGSTRLEAKRQRRREGREAGRRRTIITEAEFLARRESVDRVMVVRGLEDRTQIAVLEDDVPVEHYVSRSAQSTMVGNVYLGRVQNVLPSMEAAFVDIGKGRNAVLYAGEVNWDAAGLEGEPKRIEHALKAGASVLVQVTKDPIGHKGARLTSQISLPGRFLVYVPGSTMTGISRKLPDTERARLKKILKEVVPDDAGVIVRTAAEGASDAELRADVERLTATWERIQTRSAAKSTSSPSLLHGEPDMTVRVIRDVFNEDFSKLVVAGEKAWDEVKRYIDEVAPDLADRVEKYTGAEDVFTTYRVHEAIAKAMDRKVWLPSGGSLVIDRTEAMTVVDVNTGKFTGSGGNLEETVTKNNIEAAEEIVRQLRLRDIGGIIVIDFIDMVLESNRDLVVRRLLECLGRDRTKHQVAEVTSLGLVQMTRKRVGSGLIEVFSESCSHCTGRGVIVQTEPVTRNANGSGDDSGGGDNRRGRGRGRGGSGGSSGGGSGSKGANVEVKSVVPPAKTNGPTPAQIAAAAHAAAIQAGGTSDVADTVAKATVEQVVEEPTTAKEAPAADEAAAADEAGTADEAATSEQPPPAQATPQPPPAAELEREPAPEPRRRRRGRVVAPAGPPAPEG